MMKKKNNLSNLYSQVLRI